MGNVTAEWHNIWAHSVCWAEMRNHLSGLWLSLVYSWKTISKYFVFFTRLFFFPQDEPSPPRPEAYPIPTQTYPREYFTIPASKSQDRVVGPGQQGPPPHWQGMEDRDRLPMGDNIHNNSMQVRKLEILFRYCFSGRYNALWDPKRLVKFYYSSVCFSKSHFGDTEMFEAISLLTSQSSSPSPSFSGCELLSSSSSQFWASFVPSLMSHRGYICICEGLKCHRIEKHI